MTKAAEKKAAELLEIFHQAMYVGLNTQTVQYLNRAKACALAHVKEMQTETSSYCHERLVAERFMFWINVEKIIKEKY